jgi:chromosome segregation ATPase
MADSPNDIPNRLKDSAEKAQATARENAQRAANAGREGFRQASENATNIASRSLEMGNQALGAYVEAGKQAASALGDVNKAVTESYSRSLADYDELSKKALSCRTTQDVIDLQTTALQKMQDNINETARIYSLFIGAFTRSVEPVSGRGAQAADKAAEQAKATVGA